MWRWKYFFFYFVLALWISTTMALMKKRKKNDECRKEKKKKRKSKENPLIHIENFLGIDTTFCSSFKTFTYNRLLIFCRNVSFFFLFSSQIHCVCMCMCLSFFRLRNVIVMIDSFTYTDHYGFYFSLVLDVYLSLVPIRFIVWFVSLLDQQNKETEKNRKKKS